mmetsp:Transcript_36468/g.87941  ORF Transcript_36468/g.87941 Transcript_36468/m.87941 type:complete len:209 (+) Transcript_36468:99-725(+)
MTAFHRIVLSILLSLCALKSSDAARAEASQSCSYHRTFAEAVGVPSFLPKYLLHRNPNPPAHPLNNVFDTLAYLRGGGGEDDRIQTITSLSQIRAIFDDGAAAAAAAASSHNNHHHQQQQLVVLDFTSDNCPPCEMIKPIYADLSRLEEFENVVFCKVNVSDHPEVAHEYGVDGWPAFLLFKDGEVVDSVVGGQAARAGLYGLVAKHK